MMCSCCKQDVTMLFEGECIGCCVHAMINDVMEGAEYEPNTGWLCPRCGSANSPDAEVCPACEPGAGEALEELSEY